MEFVRIVSRTINKPGRFKLLCLLLGHKWKPKGPEFRKPHDPFRLRRYDRCERCGANALAIVD